MMPSHKVRCRTTWAGVDGWRWTTFSTRPGPSWRALRSRTAPRSWTACAWPSGWPERADGQAGGEVSGPEGGKSVAQVARGGRHRGQWYTVSRTRAWAAKTAKARQRRCMRYSRPSRPGPLVVDLADGRVLEAVPPADAAAAALSLSILWEWLPAGDRKAAGRYAWCPLHPVRAGWLGTLAVGTRAEVRAG